MTHVPHANALQFHDRIVVDIVVGSFMMVNVVIAFRYGIIPTSELLGCCCEGYVVLGGIFFLLFCTETPSVYRTLLFT
ncbi:hypothetical protein Mapa_003452 [Marchantia paleacea]|nr:hypothetical protein Mapa_003452 [Marchantia paleacea]